MKISRISNQWNHLKIWQPLIIAISLIMVIAIIHKAHWELTTETDPSDIWKGKAVTKANNETNINFPENIGDSITFKGILMTSPKFEVYNNNSIVLGEYSKDEALVYDEDLYGKTIINLSGMRILVNGDLSGKFFESEVVTVKAYVIENTSYYTENEQNITLNREGWEAMPEDVNLASDTDYYFFGTELILLAIGSYYSLNRIQNLKTQLGFAKHLALFEFKRGLKAPRMIVLGSFFTIFIVGMGWLLGDLQNSTSAFAVTSGNDGILRLSFFSFFVVSLAAIAVSVDTIHKERQSNTLNMLLARPINRETIVLGKTLGLTMVVGVPAFIAQVLGLYFMTVAGEMPTIGCMIAFLLFGQIMIFTMVSFQLCLAISARNGADVVIYGLGAWLLFSVAWTLLMYAVSFVIGIDISAQNFENDPEYQAIVSRLSLLNPGFVYQMAVGLFTHRTISIDFEGVPGWLLLLSLVLWPLTCLRIATWLFKREMRG